MARRDSSDSITEVGLEANDESSPLLSAPKRFESGVPGAPPDDERLRRMVDEPAHLYRQNVTILTLAIIFTIEIGAGMMTPPANAIMEDIICRAYMPDIDTGGRMLMDDPRCKTPDVQGRLAMVRGWQMAFDVIPSVLLAVPYGLMADKYGRKPVMFLAWLGLVLSMGWSIMVLALPRVLPLWTIYFASAFTLIGAFQCSGPAMIYTCLADVVPQAERATTFFRVNVAFLAAELIAAPLAGALMTRSVWLPVLVGFAVACLSTLTILLLPETLSLREAVALVDESEAAAAAPTSSASSVTSTSGSSSTTTTNNADPFNELDNPASKLTLRGALAMVLDSFREVWVFILGNQRLVLLMIPLVFFILGRLAQEVLLQYATKRYDMTWSRATVIMAVRSTSNLVLFVAVLPALSHLCLRRLGISAMAKDLWLARMSGVVGAVGAFMVAFSFTPVILGFSLVIFSFGYGFSPLVRSLLNALVEQHHLAMLNSMISFLELIGIMFAAPGLSMCLSAGLRMGGAWVGLPFMVAGLAFAVATGMVWVFRLPREPRQRQRVD